jgi:hypothetical protein
VLHFFSLEKVPRRCLLLSVPLVSYEQPSGPFPLLLRQAVGIVMISLFQFPVPLLGLLELLELALPRPSSSFGAHRRILVEQIARQQFLRTARHLIFREDGARHGTRCH